MIDEAQDTNPVFGGVYRKQTAVQRVYVGDSYQSIYGFRGAGDELLKINADSIRPLTASYRFGPALAKKANYALEKMGATEQIVGMADDPDDLFPNEWDVVLCRTNAGVIKAIFKNLEDGKDVNIKASYAEELVSLLNTIAWFWGYIQDKPKLHPDLEAYESKKEIEEAIEDGDESQMVIEVIELLRSKGYAFLSGVLSELNARKKKNRVEIITAHRSKGSEWDNVSIWSDFRGPKLDPETGRETMPSMDELKLGYVAVTRAKKHLDAGSLSYLIKKKEEADAS
jgi:superfamily I DNA/RNA helicase